MLHFISIPCLGVKIQIWKQYFWNAPCIRDTVPSAQLVYVTSLMWQQVLTSKGHLQVCGIKYIKEMYTSIIMFITGISISQIC